MEPKVFVMAPASSSAMGWMWGVMAGVALLTLGTLALLGWSFYAARHASFDLTSEGLKIRADIYGRSVPASSLVKEGARRLDFSASSEFLPRWRTNGIGLPGYQAGWFKLRNSEKALLFLSDRSKAVYVPTREGYALILSPDDPDRFLAELKAM